MSLDKINLPDFLIADLYKDNLVVFNDVQAPKAKVKEVTNNQEKINENIIDTSIAVAQPAMPPTAPLTSKNLFLGDNKKQIIIIVKDDEAVFLRDERLNFLSSILSACKLNLGDVAIINYRNNALSFQALQEQLNPKFMILFEVGTSELQLPFTVPNYQIQKHGTCTFLFANALQSMLGGSAEDKIEKSKLWLSLKVMFNL